MPKIIIKIDTGNAAFEDNPEYEVSRILQGVAESFMADGLRYLTLHDYNGNNVGQVIIEE